ncbi:MAG: hypothetical protein H6551_05020 [Chitinophagales bacterium]|nr:hypothetical protein [Chitinophagaceae bacterium]MCB9064489.1 hypothetical protein [Chitinophagales bacterium]
MRSMFRYYVLVILLLMQSISYAQQQDVDSAQYLFNELKAKLDRVEDYTADVRVNIDVSFMKVPPLAGKLYFKAPDKMKLERKGGISILPKKNMSLALNTVFPEGDITIIDAGNDVLDGTPVKVIKIVPHNDVAGIVLTKVWVDKERLLALRTETTTRDNGTVKMDLDFGKYANLALPDKVTVYVDVKEFKIPKGVTMDYDAGTAGKMEAPKDDGKRKKGKISINYLQYNVNAGLADSVFDENE